MRSEACEKAIGDSGPDENFDRTDFRERFMG
jgi:hypothetical protein